MDANDLNARLSRISTRWSEFLQAHEGPAEAVAAAQRVLMQRYAGAVYRYLAAMVRDADIAHDLAQEFAVRFLRGDFRRVTPERGRFRDFVKMALRNLVIDYHRRRNVRPQQMPANSSEPVDPAEPDHDFDRQFLESWRKELLERAWEALAQVQQATGKPFHAVLRFRADHPELRSAQMADQLGAQLGRPVTADWVRKTLERARSRFADLLVEDVSHSVENPTREKLEEELIEVGLQEYCRPALERWVDKS
jgi:RNA polymerase sigma-70 factor (ECF subfamily)